MRVPRRLLTAILLLTFGAAAATDERPAPDESMRYLISYRGIFSAGASIEIADAVLSARRYGADGLQELELFVTSEPHGFVESVYPFRFRARTLFQPEAHGSLAFERYRQARQRKHDLFWLDHDQGRVVRFRPDGKHPDQAQLPGEIANLIDPERRMRCEGMGARLDEYPLFDRLSLLHRLRNLDMTIASHTVAVTDGKKRLSYRITREKDETVEVAGRRWPAWKLGVVEVSDDETDSDPDTFGDLQPETQRHQPVYVWLSKSKERLPLQFENHHAIGRFLIRLAEPDYHLSPDRSEVAAEQKGRAHLATLVP